MTTPEIVVTVEDPDPPIVVSVSEMGVAGPPGPSAYDVAVANGFDGTEVEWLASLGGTGGGGGAPSGAAGGVLSGTYPDPGFAVDMATQAELDAEATARTTADALALAKAQNLADLASASTARANLGLGSVNNIADSAKPVSTAQAAADAAVQAYAVQRTNHIGTQASTTISDFTEAVQDAVNALLSAGSNITLNYDDTGNTLTVTSIGDGTGMDAEAVRDAIGVALVGVGNISVTVNDALDTITVSTTATVNSTDAALRDRTTHTGVQDISTVAGLQAALDAAQPLDSDLTTIAAVNSAGTGVLASQGTGWVMRTYTQVKTALNLGKADVGLGSVDNTADVDKPVSSATQTALNLKAPLASPALTGTPTAPTPATTDSSTTIATTAHVRAQRTASQLRDLYLKPTAALYETIPRAGQVGTNMTITSGTLYLCAIALPAGLTIGKLVWGVAAGPTSPTNAWHALFDSSRVMLARTDDSTTTTYGAGRRSRDITQVAAGAASSFTTTYEGLYYLGYMVAATTPGSLASAQSATPVNGDPPILIGVSNTAQTTPPAFPFTATALATSVSTIPWGYVAT